MFRISGRVQGVWFRDSTRRQAESLKISGYAKNLSDGTVEVLACGSEESIAALRTWLAAGPPLARVKQVSESSIDVEIPAAFTIA